MPASFIALIVSGTSSYNLSSIAVDPINSKSVSISAFASSRSRSLSLILIEVLLKSSFHSSYYLGSSFFWAKYKVLKPSRAYSLQYIRVLSKISFWPGYSKFSMTESAPLVSSQISSVLVSLTMTDILLRLLVNSHTFRSLYYFSSPRHEILMMSSASWER